MRGGGGGCVDVGEAIAFGDEDEGRGVGGEEAVEVDGDAVGELELVLRGEGIR